MAIQSEKADRLLALHHADEPLLLVNSWDAASARVVEHAGFPAIATSSAALANSLGFADGQHLPWSEMTEALGRIARAVQVPITADIEAGFSAGIPELERAIEQIVEAGAVGINLEDALPGHGDRGPLYPLEEQVERISAARKIADKLKIHLVINARTDAYWQKGQKPQEALRNTLERGKAYLQAGADCIFVPGLANPEQIGSVVGSLNAPINILGGAAVPSVPELSRLGVKRISLGSGPMRAAMGLLRRIAEETRSAGTYSLLTQAAIPYPEMNALFAR